MRSASTHLYLGNFDCNHRVNADCDIGLDHDDDYDDDVKDDGDDGDDEEEKPAGVLRPDIVDCHCAESRTSSEVHSRVLSNEDQLCQFLSHNIINNNNNTIIQQKHNQQQQQQQ